MSALAGLQFRHVFCGNETVVGSDTSRGFRLLVPPEDGQTEPVCPAKRIRNDSVLDAKILIVDDDEISVRICAEQLAELGYHQCTGLTDSTRAMPEILAKRPDLVILDVMMPVISGTEILKQIRSHDELWQLPVLILTAHSDRTTKQNVMNIGATDFLAKPIDHSDLALRVRNVLFAKRYHDVLREHELNVT